jgi:PAS domain S-box-containing protein
MKKIVNFCFVNSRQLDFFFFLIIMKCQGVELMENKSKILIFLNRLFEEKGHYILHVFCATIGGIVFLEMQTFQHQLLAALFFVLFISASIYRKKPLLFYPLITLSILLFAIITIIAKLDFYTLLLLSNNMLIVCAFLFPSPLLTLLAGTVFISLLLTYQANLSLDIIKGTAIEMVISTIFYTMFAYLIKHLYKKKGELQDSEDSNKRLLQLLPDPLVIHQEGKMVFINQEGLKLIGAKTEEEMIGRSIMDFALPDYHGNIHQRINIIHFNKEAKTPQEIKIMNLQKEILDVETTGVAISYCGKPAILTTVRDITALKKHTNMLLRESDKLSLVGQLAAGIAHEIRNPLTSLRGFIQLIQYKSEDNREYCQIMLSELDRINLIVSEFLILAKPHMVQYSSKDINQIISQVITLISTQAIINNIHLDAKLSEGLPAISCEENQLKQVMINLIKNAIEAMPNGGTITVQTEMHDSEHISIRIIDEGKGIPPELINKLGEPFYTTKEQGTGLGLMVCYKIIENHLGKLLVYSEVGQGTTFEIILSTTLSHQELELVMTP